MFARVRLIPSALRARGLLHEGRFQHAPLSAKANSGVKTSKEASTRRLRPYQVALLKECEQKVGDGANRILFSVATGLGKTAMFANLSQYFPSHQKYGILVLVHRYELIQQAKEAFEAWSPGLRIGIEQGSQTVKDLSTVDVVIASVQTLGRDQASSTARLARYKGWAGIVIVDEAHHLRVGGTYDTILTSLGVGGRPNHTKKKGDKVTPSSEAPPPPPARKLALRRLLLGFTATPFRHDKKALGDFFDLVLRERNLKWGILHGWLVDVHVFRVRTSISLDDVATRMGDLAEGQLQKAVNVHERNAAAVKIVVFCTGVAHARALARMLEEQGISAAVVYGDMPDDERQETLRRFREGDLRVVTNCGVLTEGFDAPVCDTIVMCRPTLSKGLYLQMIGRGTRPRVPLPADGGIPTRLSALDSSPKPFMRLIDLVDNCSKHKVLSMPALLGLRSDVDLNAENLTVRQVLAADEELAGEDWDAEAAGAMSEEERERIRLRIHRFRLIDSRQTAGPESASLARPLLLGLDGSDIREGDRLIIHEPSTKGKAEGPRNFACPMVKIVRLEQARKEGMGGRVKLASSVLVHMHGPGDTRLEWSTGRLRDVEGEEVFEGQTYLLTGTVTGLKMAHGLQVIQVTRAALHPVHRPQDERLEGLYEQVVRGELPIEDWLTSVKSFLRRA